MNVLVLGFFEDIQTGIYIMEAFEKYSSDVAGLDIRRIVLDEGSDKSQETILKEIDELKIEADIVLVLKGLEITTSTLDKIRARFPKAKIVNWMFDTYIGELRVWDNDYYKEYIKHFDYFFCSLKGVSDRLRQLGFDNVYHLPEGCSPSYNGETYLNYYQEQKYGEDVAFCGTLGYTKQHPNRIPTLAKVVKEGFNMKIWGNVICDWKFIPLELRKVHMQEDAININHSKVAQASKVNLGIDQDPELEQGQSARMYRVMSAGGLYLNTATKGLDKVFNINKEGEEIKDTQDLVVYYNMEDMIDKIDFLLEHEDIRAKIAKNGQEKVLKEHTFEERIKNMLEVINNGKEERR